MRRAVLVLCAIAALIFTITGALSVSAANIVGPPCMSSDNSSGFRSWANSIQAGGESWRAFDCSAASYWTSSVAVPDYITIDLGLTYNVTTYTIGATGSGNAGAWNFAYSNDNVTWTIVDTRSGQTTTGGLYNYTPSTTGLGRYWRLTVTAANSDPWAAINTLAFFGAQSAPSSTATPTWVSPTPANASSNNTQVTINASSTSPARYFVWFDTNPNPTTLVVNNATTGNYTTSVGVSTQTYYYKAQAWNSTGGYSANSSVQNWTFDRVSPSLTIQPNNEFNLQNYSRRNPFDHVLNLNLTVGDDHALYGFSVNVTRTGTVYFNYSNETLTGTQYNYTASVDTTTWPVGRYDVNIQASDSHTKNAIKDYVVTKAQSKLRFQTDEGNDISIETDDPASVDAVKDNDRYSFEFSYNGKGSKARTFHVKSATPIVYLPSSSYKAHFIVKNGVQGNWIDFEGVTGTPIVTKVTENHYVVRFDNLPDKLAFHSIGGLNVLDANYSFYNGNYSLQNPSPVFTGEAIVLGLNMTNDASSITSIMANLTYNGTVYAPSATNDSVLYQFTQARTNPNVTATIAYNWTLNVTEGDGYSMLFNISASHSIQDWGIISCGSPAFINWTQYDEDTPANLNAGTFQVGLTYWVGNKSNAKTYNATYALASSWSLCFTPVDANFTANIYAQNTVMGGFTHRFYIQNANYSNSTTFYKLYSPLNTSLSAYSDLTITTRQSTDYKYFKNVYAQLQRFYIGTGTWLTVQYDKSGDFGLLFFDVKEQSVDYRLLYYNENNTLLKQTDSLKFVCTSGVCELTQLLDPAASGVTAATVTSSLSFNNATGILSVNWTGSSTTASTVVIKIVKLATTTTSICSTTQTGNAGSFTCNATGYTGTLYATVDADGKPNAATYFDVPRASIGSLISPAFSSLITFILMLTIIGFGLFSPMGLVIAVILSLVVVYWIGIFTPITVTFLIISAVIGFVISIKVKQ